MFEENKITLKDGNEVTIKPFEGDRLAGSVVIDNGIRPYPGIFLGGGLSGDVVIPDALNEPAKPIRGTNGKFELPKGIENGKLAGYIVPVRETDNILISLLDIKKIVDELVKRHPDLENNEVLNELYDLLEEKYNFNRDYMDDYNISNNEKVSDVKGVVNNNLEDIRNAVLDLQEELDKEDSKGL